MSASVAESETKPLPNLVMATVLEDDLFEMAVNYIRIWGNSLVARQEINGTDMPVDIRLFGKWEVWVHGKPLPRLRSRAGQNLLALLALRTGQPLERGRVAAILWPDSDEEQALYNLRRNLTDLRSALGMEAGRIESPSPRTLRLNLETCFCDALAFDAACRSGLGQSDQHQEYAISLYRGPLLDEFVEEWVVQEREARAQTYISLLEALAQRESGRENWTEAIRYLRLAAAADTYNEPIQCALIEALASAGDMAAATLVYRDFRLRLHEEIQSAPARETTELYQRLQARARQRASSPTKTARDLGNATSQNHLPRPLAEFVGRTTELAEIETCLRSARLVTLTGIGGIGKTRLAVAAAEQISAPSAQEAWFVDLAPVLSDAPLEQVVADTFGVRPQQGRTLRDTLLAALAQRRLLLVLDNCEHLLSQSAHLVTDLLDACPNLRILATSRQALGVAGEVTWRVPPLSMPSAGSVFEETTSDGIDVIDDYMRKFDAVRLFVGRALDASPNWTLNSRKLAAIAAICKRVDGIPLALELAAARVKVLSVEQIAQRLGDAFALLTGSRAAMLPRHQTLRAAIDWSYDLLTDSERRLLADLSVFGDGWTLEAAEAICGRDSLSSAGVLDTLSELVDKSLVLAEEDADGQIRYRLLETIRQYGQEKLYAEGEAVEMHRRHGNYYLAFAQEASKHLTGPQMADWLNRLEADHGNLRLALTRPTDAETGLRLACALVFFWKLRGYLREGSEWLSRLLATSENEAGTPLRARALRGAGILAYDRGDFETACTLYQQSLALFQEQDSRPDIAHLLVDLGNVAYRQGDYGTARHRYEEGLELFRELGQKSGIASALGSLGNIEDAEGNYAAARCLQEESLVLSRSLGDTRMTAYTLHNLGNLAVREGAPEYALLLYEESLAMKRTLGDRRGIASSLNSLGIVAAEADDHDSAEKRFREALALAREVEDKSIMINALDGLAWQAATREEPLWAARLWGASERGHETLKMPYSQEERDLYDVLIETARQKSSAHDFASAWAEGYALLLEQAVQEVLARST